MTALPNKPNQGMLQLVLEQIGQRTTIKDCYYHVPLQVLRPTYRDNSGMAYIYLLNPCGGVVGGDQFDISITLKSGAHAYVTTPSATKLYPTPGPVARQAISCTLESDSVLVYMPEQTIPFADAEFEQRIYLQLAPGATVFLGDILAPGRIARGEYFNYRAYDSHLRIDGMGGEALLEDHIRLCPRYQRLKHLALFEGYAYLTSFYAAGLEQIQASHLTGTLYAQIESDQHLLGGATELPHGGVAVRLLSHNHRTAYRALHMVWDTVRRYVYGCPAAACRM